MGQLLWDFAFQVIKQVKQSGDSGSEQPLLSLRSQLRTEGEGALCEPGSAGVCSGLGLRQVFLGMTYFAQR